METPTEKDINILEKAAWDAHADRTLVWHYDEIQRLQRDRELYRGTLVGLLPLLDGDPAIVRKFINQALRGEAHPTPPPAALAPEELVSNMLAIYGVQFTDATSREIAVETWAGQFRAALAAPPPARAEIEGLRSVLSDAWSALRYIRAQHGDVYGVGWDRLDATVPAAIALETPAPKPGIGELFQMFADGVAVARRYGDNAVHLHGEQLQRRFKEALARMESGLDVTHRSVQSVTAHRNVTGSAEPAGDAAAAAGAESSAALTNSPPPARAEAPEEAQLKARILKLEADIIEGGRERDDLRAEVARLTKALASEERAHLQTIDERDRAQEAADRLAYAIADEDAIGEHTNLNDPWANAVDALEQERAQHAEALGRMQVSFSAEEQRALKAEAERDQQAEHVAVLNAVIREHNEFGALFQPGGRFHTIANLPLGKSAVLEGGRWLVQQFDQLRRALEQAACDLTLVGSDYPGSSCEKWCREKAEQAHAALAASAPAVPASTPEEG